MGLDEWEMQFIDAICLYENSNLRDTVKYGGKQFSVSQMQRLLSDTGRQLRNIHNTPDAAARTSITQETVGDFIREDIGLDEQEEAFLFGRTMSEREKAVLYAKLIFANAVLYILTLAALVYLCLTFYDMQEALAIPLSAYMILVGLFFPLHLIVTIWDLK